MIYDSKIIDSERKEGRIPSEAHEELHCELGQRDFFFHKLSEISPEENGGAHDADGRDVAQPEEEGEDD